MKKQTHKNTTNELREVNNTISELLEELNNERARISAIQSEAEKALDAINKTQRTIAKLEVAIQSAIANKGE